MGNLQELVYKQGQAGVTKATVTVVFDNSDISSSPVGYESYKQITVTRQVVIGGKNKYMINGRTVQQNEVQNLFHSVQLNVNNPHFLIMQGRITKVLNMKPMEILGMIEEAAGTRMFETKKQAAIKTIEKKQLKVDELTKCMNEEINPTLDSLRTERQQYQTWITNNNEIEKLERFCIAHTFVSYDERAKSSEQDRRQITDELNIHKQVEDSMMAEAEQVAAQIAQIEKSRESESDGPLAVLKVKENELSKDLVKLTALLNNQSETLVSEKETASNLSKQIESVKSSVTKRTEDQQKCKAELTIKENEVILAEKTCNNLRERYQNACAGVADESSATLLSLPEQVATWERKERETESQLQQGQLKAEHAKSSLKTLRKMKQTQQSVQDKTTKELEAAQNEVKELEKLLAEISHNPEEESSLRSEASSLKQQIAHLRDDIGSLTVQIEARLNFKYKDPERDFDRSRVKGLVAQLMQIKDPRTTTALEVVAGAKLYQIVVDNEQTGKLLVEKGQLRRRVTILPLNKISCQTMDSTKLQAAKDLAKLRGGTAHLALELVECDSEVQRAMAHVFGNVIVCDSAATAQAISFAPNIRVKTVTLEGDTYDPSGTVTGGSNDQIGTLLTKISTLNCSRNQLSELENRLNDVSRKLNRSEEATASARDLMTTLESRRQSLIMSQEKLAGSQYTRTVTEIAVLEAQIESVQKVCRSYTSIFV